MDVSYFLDKFIEFKTLTKQQKLKIKHFQRDYHNDIDLLPNACMAYMLSIYTPHKYKRNMYNDFCDLIDSLTFKSFVLREFDIPVFNVKAINHRLGKKINNDFVLYQEMLNNVINHWKAGCGPKYDSSNDEYIYRLSQDTLLLLSDKNESNYPILAYELIPEFKMRAFLQVDGMSKYPNSKLSKMALHVNPKYIQPPDVTISDAFFNIDRSNKLELIFHSPVFVDNTEYSQLYGLSPEIQSTISCWINYYLAQYVTDSADVTNVSSYIRNHSCNLEDLWLMSAYMLYVANSHLANPKKYSKLVDHLNDAH